MLAALSALVFLDHPHAQGLDDYRWESRLLVVATPSLDDPYFRQQKEESSKDLAGWADRRLLSLVIADGKLAGTDSGSAVDGRQILSRLGLSDKHFSVVLVGLDGTVKLRRETAVSNRELYRLIDAMPMRQEELRLRNSQ